MNNPLVSVIVPVYNSKKYIHKCLDSLLSQTYQNIEIICIDDESNDNSLEILRDYNNKYQNIKVFSQKNSGAAIARNYGIEQSTGEYLLFVDSDDYIENTAVEKLVKNILSNKSDIVLFNSDEFNSDGHIRDRIYYKINPDLDYNNFTFNYKDDLKLVLNTYLVCWSKFYKKSFLVSNYIKFSNKEIFNDVQIHVETIFNAKKISYQPDILYHYRKENELSLQTSRGTTKKSFILFDVFAEIYDYFLINECYDLFKFEYLLFVVKESRNRFNIIQEDIRGEFFNIMKDFFIKMNFDYSDLKKLNKRLYDFYIHVIIADTYLEFMTFNSKNLSKYMDKSLLKLINEKNEEIIKKEEEIKTLKYYKNILTNISDSFEEGMFLDKNIYDSLVKKGLFDENFYINEYDYDLDIHPFIHYIYQGYLENKNPSIIFDGEYYKTFNKNVNETNPLLYFINTGINEGKIKINKRVHQLRAINKIELDEKIKKLDSWKLNVKKREEKIIISLTSIPDRIEDIIYCIYSFFDQTFKPDKIILWLSEEDFPNKELDIPDSILNLRQYGLSIKWTENLKAYKKLIPSLENYPNDLIVTADDDLYYPKEWLEKLYMDHKKYPKSIIIHRARKIEFNEEDEIKRYRKMNLITEETEPTYLNLFTGGAGALYPPKSLYKDVLKKDLFTKLCPTGDDLWFWSMSVLNRTKSKLVEGNYNVLTYVSPEVETNLFGQKTLWSVNKHGKNDKQLKNIMKYYPKLKKILKEEYNDKEFKR